VTDVAVKLALLRAGIGWGYMPMHLVDADLARGSLVKIALSVRPGGQQLHAAAPGGCAARAGWRGSRDLARQQECVMPTLTPSAWSAASDAGAGSGLANPG